MNSRRTVFAQLIEHLLHKEFQKCVARYRGDRYTTWVFRSRVARSKLADAN